MGRSREDDDDEDTLNLSDEPEGEEEEGGEEEGEEEEESEEDPDDPDSEEGEEGDDDGDPEDRGDDEGEDPDAEEEEPDPELLRRVARGGKAGSVPHARFNEVNEERKRLLAILEKQQQGGGAAAPKKGEEEPAFDLKAKIKERNKLLLEGKEDEAAELDAEILTHQQKVATASARAEAAQAREAERLDEVAEAAIAEYPFLNPQSKKHNAEALEEVQAMRDLYIRKGDKPHVALQKAVERVCPRYEEEREERGGKRDRDDGGGKPKQKGKDGESEGDGKKPKKDVKSLLRRAAAAARTPPNTRDAGAGNRERNAADVDPADMDDDEYDALPESEKRRMRGDVVKSVEKRRGAR